MNQGIITVTYRVNKSELDRGINDAQKKMKKAAAEHEKDTKKMSDSWKKVGAGFAQIGSGIRLAVAESAAVVNNELISPVTNKVAALGSKVGAGLTAVGDRVAKFVEPVTSRVSAIAKSVSTAFTSVGNGVISAMTRMKDGVLNRISLVTNGIVGFGQKVGGAFVSVGNTIAAPFISLGNKLSSFLAPVGQKISAVFGGIGNAISTNLAPGLSTVSAGISELTSGATDKIGGMVRQISPQLASLGTKIKDKLGGALSHVGSVASGLGKAFAVGTAAAAVAIGGLAKKSVEGFAEWEQLVGGVDTLFKKSSDTVQAYAANAYKTAGLSANQYMETVTSFSASLLQGLKGDTEKSAQYAHMAVTDMADNANKMGTSMSIIQDAYQGFAKDNYTMLDNLKLGYGGTAGEMARLVNESGVMGKGFKATAENVKDIPFDKLIEAIHKVQERMGITGTTAKEASETISGSFYSMKSAWSNLVAGIGNEDLSLDQLVGNFMTSLETFLKNLTPALAKSIGGIAMALPQVVDQLLPLIPPIMQRLIPAVVQGAVALIQGLVAAFPSVLQALLQAVPALVAAATQLFMSLLLALPDIITALVNAVPALVNTVVDVLSSPESLQQVIMGTITLLLATIDAVPTIINALVIAIPRIVDAIINTVTKPEFIVKMGEAAVRLMFGIVRGIGSMIGNIGNATWQVINQIASVLSPSSLFNIGVNFLKGLWNGINNVTGWIVGKIKGFTDGVIKSIKGFFGIHSPSRVMMQIGEFLGEGMAIGISGSADGVLSAVDNMNDAIYGRIATSITPDLALSGSGSVSLRADDIWGGKNNGGPNDGYPQINQTVNLTNGIDVDQYNRSLVQQMRRGY